MGKGLLDFYRNKVKREWKIAFYAGFLACILIHIYKFTNTLPNHDSLYNVYSNQNMTVSGRWFLQYACGLSSYFDLPWINGLLCAVYLGLTAAMVTELLDIRNPVVIVLSALVLSASPSTTETLFFGFTADGYLLGLTLGALAACLSCKGRFWWTDGAAVLCICLSCAVYQAYVSCAAVLCICWLVLRLLENKISVRDSWKWIGRHLLIYGVALAAYYGIWKLVLFATGQSATVYQGIDSVGKIGLSTVLSGVVKSGRNLFFYFLEWNILEHPITLYGALNIVFFIALGAVLVTAVVKSGIHKSQARLGMVLLCLTAAVPVMSLWCFLSEGVAYRPMMLHSACVFYILALILFDRWVSIKVSTLFGLFMAVVLFNFAIMANISYFYLDKCYEKSYYTGSRMMERIETASGAEEVDRIAIVGIRKENVVISNTVPGSHVHLLTEQLEADLLFDSDHVYNFLSHVFGMEYEKVKPEEAAALAMDERVREMGIWPASDSVAVVNGVLVIKLQEMP